MKWTDEQTNRVGQLALVGKASKWVVFLTLNDSTSLSTLDEFKKAFLERFNKMQSVLEAQRLISNLRQSSEEDVQDFFERVSTFVMLSFKESIIDMKKEFVGGHVACIEKASKLMCEQIIKRLFISGQSDPNMPNFRQWIALRRDWVYCNKCGQWGKHKGNECQLSQAKINSLRRQDPRNPPTSRLSDGQYDNS